MAFFISHTTVSDHERPAFGPRYGREDREARDLPVGEVAERQSPVPRSATKEPTPRVLPVDLTLEVLERRERLSHHVEDPGASRTIGARTLGPACQHEEEVGSVTCEHVVRRLGRPLLPDARDDERGVRS